MIKASRQPLFGWMVVAGTSLFIGAGVVTALLERDHNIVNSSLSSYAVSPFGYIMEIGFFALALAHGMLAVALAQRPLAQLGWTRVALVGLGVVALAVLFVALFPANGLGNVGGFNIHGTAATISFVIFPPVAILLALACRGDQSLRAVAPAALVIALVNTLALAIFGIAVVGHLPWIWLAEKADAFVTAVWLIVVGNGIRRVGQ